MVSRDRNFNQTRPNVILHFGSIGLDRSLFHGAIDQLIPHIALSRFESIFLDGGAYLRTAQLEAAHGLYQTGGRAVHGCAR